MTQIHDRARLDRFLARERWFWRCCRLQLPSTPRPLLGARSGPRRFAGPIGVAVVDATDELNRVHVAYARRTWMDACKSLSHVDEAAPLEAEALELLATSAYMRGRDDECGRPRAQCESG